MAAVARRYGHPPFRSDACCSRSGAISDHLSSLEPSLEQVRRPGCRCSHDHLRWWSSGQLPWKLGKPWPEDLLEWRMARRVYLPEITLTDRRGSLQAFVQAARTGQEPECSGRDNLHSLALMYAAVESATFRSCISLAGRKADAGVN